MLTVQTAKNNLINITPDLKPFVEKEESLVEGLLFIKQGQSLHKVSIEDILYLESDNVYIYVHTTAKKYVVRNTIPQYLDLLNSAQFFRIHRSYAINIAHVYAIDNTHVFIKNVHLPLGKTYKDEFLSSLKIG